MYMTHPRKLEEKENIPPPRSQNVPYGASHKIFPVLYEQLFPSYQWWTTQTYTFSHWEKQCQPYSQIYQRALFLLWNITIKTMCFGLSCECSSNTSDYKAHLEVDHAENNPTFLQTSWFGLDTSDFLSHNTVLTKIRLHKDTTLGDLKGPSHVSPASSPPTLPLTYVQKKPLLIRQVIQSHHNRYDLLFVSHCEFSINN